MKCNYTKQIRNAVSLCAVGVMSLALFGEAQTASADTYIVAPMADTYLQSDGTQAIDTGYNASDKTKVVIDFEIVSTNASAAVFGSYGSGLPYRLGLSYNVTSLAFAYNLGGSDKALTSDVPLKLTRYAATFDAASATVTVSNALVGATAAGTGNENTNNVPLAVFGRQTALGSFNALSACRIYSMQIYDDGTLVRDFIPYGFGATTGLYDRVNGKVHGNARTSGNPFVIGHGDAYVRGSEIAPAYVNTGVTPTPDTKVEIDFAMMSATKNSRVFGNLGGSAFCMDLHVDKDGSGNFFYSMQDGRTGGYTTSFGVDADRHVFALSTNEVLLASADGTVTNFIATSFPNRTYAKTAQGPMVAFGASNSANPVSGSQFPCDVKVYGMKIWEDGLLVRDFTPRMVDGKFGFWDSVEDEFHGTINANDLRGGGAIESDADPISACTVSPQGGMVRVNRTLTLAASAPNATHYQWFLDGEMLEGATGSTFDVEWTQDSNLVRRYRCLAFFNAFGYAESDEAVVRNTPAGTIIYMR